MLCRRIVYNIGLTNSLGEVLSWLPDRVTKQKRYNNTMLFRVESEIAPVVQIRLKVEINCFEHFNVLGMTKVPFSMNNPWFTGAAELTTYHFEELLGNTTDMNNMA